MRAIDGDRLKRKAQKVATEAWKMKTKATVEAILNEFIDWINEAPTIEPERKTGRWIHDGYAFKGGIDWMHCSECGHKDSWSAATRTPFCAWCGAKMEGES